ncbi:LOW QUALITY PROTEIN: uncharacterized protein LOC132917186 [Rhopalosiphum padi]|uniref:LOW QUALITY PROTEIN: uncharacterized protein LOC132917186 n=1 Tax=Rhopalosiphum padi TaxID=40932 RepID=UPI00298DCEBC|nr:LOW QUALITY PROTEIN: uncharacterized protein LOC132917186 [Rhopalosiphum padi]
MCTNDIASKMNHWEISPNQHQTVINRRVLFQEHLEKLSEVFGGNVPADFEVNCNPTHLLADVDHYSVDLKAMKKLMKLCSLLRKNVIDLKTVYKKRCRMSGGYYTESERAEVEPELRSLEEDVQRMMDVLKDISGNSHEIKHVLKMYTENENRYVRLLSLNKSAKLRYQAKKTENGTNDGEFHFGLCDEIYKWVRNSCPFTFITAREKNVKRKWF